MVMIWIILGEKVKIESSEVCEKRFLTYHLKLKLRLSCPICLIVLSKTQHIQKKRILNLTL